MAYTYELNAALVISGIPFAFGSRAGDVITTSGTTLTTIAAQVAGSLSIGDAELDLDSLVVPPYPVSLSIVSSLSWDRYFHRKRAPQTELTTALTESGTTVVLATTAGLTAGDLIYIDRETIIVGTVVGDGVTLTGCTRSAWSLGEAVGSVHLAGSTVGTSPRHQLGRTAALYLYQGCNSSTPFKTLSLKMSSGPRFNAKTGTWDLSFDTRIAELDRNFCVGLIGSRFDATIAPTTAGNADDGFTVALRLQNGSEFRDNAGDQGCLLVTSTTDDSKPPVLISSWTYALGFFTPTITVDAVGIFAPSAGAPGNPQEDGSAQFLTSYDFVRRVYVFQEMPMLAAMQVLLSMRGEKTNHATYDVLFGSTSSDGSTGSAAGRLGAGELERRFGAGLPSSLVTVPADRILDKTCPGFFFVAGAHGEESLLAFLEEVAWHVGGFWFFDSDGKLAFRLFEAYYNNEVFSHSLTDNDIGIDSPMTITDDESRVVASFTIKCNRSLKTGDTLVTASARYEAEGELYRENNATVEVTRNTLVLDAGQQLGPVAGGDIVPATATIEQARVSLDRQFARRSICTRTFDLVLPWAYASLLPGDRIRVTSSWLPDLAGSKLTAFAVEVVGVGLDILMGRVHVKCVEIWNAGNIAPTSQISSYVSGTKTITLLDGSKWHDDWNLWPVDWFAAGWQIKILRYAGTASGIPYSEAVDAVIASLDELTMVLTTAPVYASDSANPGVKDIVTLDTYDDCTSTAETANALYTMSMHDFVHMADDSGFLGAANAQAFKWG